MLLFLVCSAFIDSAAAEIDFSRDVLPILSDACFKCHGPDEGSREADLRLDDEANAKEDRGGYSVVVAGDAKQSELLTRVLSQDASEVMPPPDTGKTLTDEQVETLRQWIQQGAKWTTHWAFEAPTRSIPPAVADKAPAGWSQHPIDAFVLRRIEDAGLTPSPPASAETLLRRLHLDLIGLPPTLEERRAFLADARPDAIDQVIDQLLDSPHYGERWGRHWLDAARYSDSDGYEKDMRRQNWHYRDWVVNAINADKPYDQFIVEQIAGDLLPNAGQDEFVATGFLRNSMVNEEGGADPEQFRVEGLFDRMDAIGKSVLGITTQCAQCHTHKYDPLTHADYFGMFAFLNNCNESITPVYTDDEQRQIVNIREQIEEIEMALRESTPDWRDRIALWKELQVPAETDWHVLRADRKDYTGQKFAILTDGSILSQSYAPPRSTDGFIADSPLGRITAIRLEMLTHPDLPRGGPGRSMYGTNALTEFKAARVDDNGKEHPVAFSMATSSINVPSRPLGAPFAVNGKQPEERVVGPVSYAIDGDTKTAWTTQGSAATRNQASEAVFVLDKPLVVPASNKLVLRLQQDHGGKLGNQRNTNIAGRFRFSVTDTADPVAEPLPAKVRQIVSRDIDGWDAADWFVVFSHWRTTRPEWSVANARIDELLDRFPQGVNQYVVTERSQDERRVTYRMDRGNFLSPDERIEPHTPAFLHPLRESDEPDRLRFARWLADRKSPTTARAIVNRVWQEYFGTGIVETTEDLGLQAPPASHPDLLDWLAVDLMEHGWSLKHLHRLIVTSATYRQTSSAIQSLLLADPNNRLLARGPRVRVQAEVVRDIALAASGLLNLRLGGPTVYPPAPKFLYLPPTSYGVKQWETSHDRADYRRSLYVQAYRSVPYPPMQLFDAPNGNAACVRRGRSNTPLQALALLNEPQFVECARALAGRIMESEDLDERSRIAVGFEMLLSRQPSDDEIEALANFVAAARAKLANGEVNAFDITGLPSDTDSEHCEELAAWTLAARCLLNLDETITKQ
ncbi:MAG: PSD1 and planctomycete cytochrome C domain-containing protein [Planctomycetota bacterium]